MFIFLSFASMLDSWKNIYEWAYFIDIFHRPRRVSGTLETLHKCLLNKWISENSECQRNERQFYLVGNIYGVNFKTDTLGNQVDSQRIHKVKLFVLLSFP